MPGRVVPIVSVAFLIWWPWSKLQVKSFRISEINYIKTKNSGLVILGWKSNLPKAHTRQVNQMVIKWHSSCFHLMKNDIIDFYMHVISHSRFLRPPFRDTEQPFLPSLPLTQKKRRETNKNKPSTPLIPHSHHLSTSPSPPLPPSSSV